MKLTHVIATFLAVGALSAGALTYLHAQSAPKFSREDALEMQLLQKQLNEIIQEANKSAAEAAQKKAQPILERGNVIQDRVCKANGFPSGCYVDAEHMKVLAKAPEKPAGIPPPAKPQ